MLGVCQKIRDRLPRGAAVKPATRQPLRSDHVLDNGVRRVDRELAQVLYPLADLRVLVGEEFRADATERGRETSGRNQRRLVERDVAADQLFPSGQFAPLPT